MCSKALYRVKTMDSLDYKDLVCVVSNTISPIAMLHVHKSKERDAF